MTIPYVTYYAENNISPVGQDISDIGRHYGRRAGLYRQLGIAPALARGKAVIEFGPGSGYNSIYTKHLEPSLYVLVDGNPTGLDAAEKLLSTPSPANPEAAASQSRLEFHLSLIERYEDTRLFDIVLCENMLPGRNNVGEVLARLSSLVAPGGVLVITCQDSVSMLSDMIRRAMGRFMLDMSLPLEEQAASVVPLFRPHFENLPGMSRRIEDWILDTVTHPWENAPHCSMKSVIGYLKDGFHVYGSSPDFLVDWRWYKDIDLEDRQRADSAIEIIGKNCHNLLDYRFVSPPRNVETNAELYKLADEAWQLGLALDDNKAYHAFADLVGRIAGNIDNPASDSAITAKALRDAAAGLKSLEEKREKSDFGSFRQLFGRGVQYMSFIKKR